MKDAQRIRPCVLIVGPDPSWPGGMSAVVGQMLSDLPNRGFDALLHAATASPSPDETRLAAGLRHLRHARSLARTIQGTHATIVHIHTCSGFTFYRSLLDLWIARRMGCRVVLHVHGAAFDEFCRSAGLVRRRIIARGLAAADRVIALSAGWRDQLRRASPRADIVVIENAVDVPVRAERRTHDGPCRFLLLAKMDEWKGVDDLLNACVTLHGTGVTFELTLAGPPGSAGDATTLAGKIAERSLGAAVRYVGPVYGEAKRDLLARTDVYVQPSHHEGMPLAVLEAMSYSLPVVATRVGAVPEVVADGENGLLVPPGRPDALAAAMAQLAGRCHGDGDAEIERRRLGAAGRRIIEARFTLERFLHDCTVLYGELHGGQSAPATRWHTIRPPQLGHDPAPGASPPVVASA